MPSGVKSRAAWLTNAQQINQSLLKPPIIKKLPAGARPEPSRRSAAKSVKACLTGTFYGPHLQSAITNNKHQISNKHQLSISEIPNGCRGRFWLLEIGYWNLFVIWYLLFGAFSICNLQSQIYNLLSAALLSWLLWAPDDAQKLSSCQIQRISDW